MTTDIDKLNQAKSLIDEVIANMQPPPAAPPVIDCLAGTYSGSINMFPDEASEASWLNKRAAHRVTMANEPDGSIMLIGDSMIENGDFSPLGNHINLGISGESARQIYQRLDENDSNGNPNYIHRCGACVILTAVNDLSDSRNGSEANTAATMAFIFNKMNTWLTGKVIIFKLIHVDSSIHSAPSANEINLTNDEIDNEFGNNPAITIIDLNPTVAPNGSLLPQYHNGDGQHPSLLMIDLMNQEIQAALSV